MAPARCCPALCSPSWDYGSTFKTQPRGPGGRCHAFHHEFLCEILCALFMTQPIRTLRIATFVAHFNEALLLFKNSLAWHGTESSSLSCEICLVYFSITQYQKRGKVLGTRNSRLRTCINYHQLPSTCLGQCCHCHKVRHWSLEAHLTRLKGWLRPELGALCLEVRNTFWRIALIVLKGDGNVECVEMCTVY
jgi:hypothetical protein